MDFESCNTSPEREIAIVILKSCSLCLLVGILFVRMRQLGMRAFGIYMERMRKYAATRFFYALVVTAFALFHMRKHPWHVAWLIISALLTDFVSQIDDEEVEEPILPVK